MQYIKVQWIHKFANEPTEMFSELNNARWELRKVEIYANGEATFAGSNRSTGSSRLSETPLPTLDKIALDPQFLPQEISRSEFEDAWERAQKLR
jgi:hypothetical protein